MNPDNNMEAHLSWVSSERSKGFVHVDQIEKNEVEPELKRVGMMGTAVLDFKK